MLGTAAGCYHESGLWSAVSVLGCAMKNSKQTPSELGSCAGLHFKLPFVATVRATGCSRWISGDTLWHQPTYGQSIPNRTEGCDVT